MFGGLAVGFAKLAKPSQITQGMPSDSAERRRRRVVRRPR